MLNKMAILKNLRGCFEGREAKRDKGGGLVSSSNFRLLKIATEHSLSNRVSPLESFCDNTFHTRWLGEEKKQQKAKTIYRANFALCLADD